MGLVGTLVPGDPPQVNVRAAKVVSEKATEVGLTTIHDIYISSDEMRGYQQAHDRGWLKVRVQCHPGSEASPTRKNWLGSRCIEIWR